MSRMFAGCGRPKWGIDYASDDKHGLLSPGGLRSLAGIRRRGRLPRVVRASETLGSLLRLRDLPVKFSFVPAMCGTRARHLRFFSERPARPNQRSKERRVGAPRLSSFHMEREAEGWARHAQFGFICVDVVPVRGKRCKRHDDSLSAVAQRRRFLLWIRDLRIVTPKVSDARVHASARRRASASRRQRR